MALQSLTSLQHPLVKHMAKLRIDRGYRASQKSAVVFGKKLIHDLSLRCSFKTLLVTDENEPGYRAEQRYKTTREIIKKISGIENPEGIAAEVELPEPNLLENKKFLVVFDQIQDPGNMGTLIRTALALGFEGALVLDGSVDPFNDKAIRSAKGASFFLPLRFGNIKDLEALIQKERYHCYVGDLEGTPIEQCRFEAPYMLILGSEGKGPQEKLKSLAAKVCIPMSEGAESLNVAIAGGIIMYAIKRASHV